jgi:hypothetical protein
MKTKTIENLITKGENNIDYQKLYLFMNHKLDDLYKKEKITPLFDYQEIQYSAMIDLIYEIMPSLKNEL